MSLIFRTIFAWKGTKKTKMELKRKFVSDNLFKSFEKFFFFLLQQIIEKRRFQAWQMKTQKSRFKKILKKKGRKQQGTFSGG